MRISQKIKNKRKKGKLRTNEWLLFATNTRTPQRLHNEKELHVITGMNFPSINKQQFFSSLTISVCFKFSQQQTNKQTNLLRSNTRQRRRRRRRNKKKTNSQVRAGGK